MNAPSLTVGYVPGGTPAKWARNWSQRHPQVPLELRTVTAADAAAAVRTGAVDVAVLRLPSDTSALAVIPLYEETTVAVVPTDHLVTASTRSPPRTSTASRSCFPSTTSSTGRTLPVPPVEHRPETVGEAVELVAAGVGILIVPQSLARLHHRKDLTYRPIVDAPTCPVALAVPEGPQPPLVEDFIGIVRGRRPGSSRGQTPPPPKRTAREKTLAKQAARAAAGKVARKPGRPQQGR